MEKKKYEKAGLEIRLVGVVLILTVVFVEGASILGLWNAIDAYWLRTGLGEIIMCSPVLIYLIWYRKQFVSMLRLNPVKIRVVLLAILVEICVTPLAGLCNLVTGLFTPNVVEASLGTNLSSTSYGLMILSMALIPAIVEELAMRGIVLSAFSSSGRKFTAIVFASVCFGLIHGNINQFAYAFIVGMTMALVDEAADSVYPSIAMHFFTNGFSITFMYIMQYTAIAEEQARDIMAQLGESSPEAEIVLSQELIDKLVDITMIITIVVVAGLAVGGLFGASKLIAKIAAISGRTEYMRSIKPKFGKRKKALANAYATNPANTADPANAIYPANTVNPGNAAVPELPKTKILNPVLIIGMAVWVGMMVLYELVIHGVIG